MNHTIFSVTYIAIVAAAGLATGVPMAWQFAAVTAALAFFAGEADEFWQSRIYESGEAACISRILAAASWLTGAAAGIALLF